MSLRPALIVLLGLGAGHAGAPAAPPATGTEGSQGQIYSCVDAQGHRLSSDRPIPECLGQDQRMLRRDGSIKAIVPPAQTPEEKARQEAAKRQADQIRLAREAEARRDRALLNRYPDQATHDQARAKAQEGVAHQIDIAQRRLRELEAESQALTQEREAAGKVFPPSLRARMAANEGALEAQRTILRDQEAERDRLNQQFDTELNRLRALWAGAIPGRLGPITPAPARPASAP
ncbi:MAG TPA: DUF4124 domain-containing protein [Ideonella sp.]|jgi:hypothetical protein|nr:DUF4124 domain-containing protein [Ideonella sp.]